MIEWKRELLLHRIREINGVRFTLPGNSYCNYGAPHAAVEVLIKAAIHHLEADELDQCERACERAERAQIATLDTLCCCDD